MNPARKYSEPTAETGTLVVFPPARHVSWRPIEAVALRRAGGATGSVRPAIDNLAQHWLNLPPDILRNLLDAAREHIEARVIQHRKRVGNTPFAYRDRPAEVIPMPGPDEAA